MPPSLPPSRIDGDAPVAVGSGFAGVTARAYSPAVTVGGQVLIALLFVLFFHVLMVFSLLLLPPLLVALSVATGQGWMAQGETSDLLLLVLIALASGGWSYLLFRAGLRVTRDFPQGRSAFFMLAAFLLVPALFYGFGLGTLSSFGPIWLSSITALSLAGMALAWRHRQRRAAAVPKTDLMSPGDLP